MKAVGRQAADAVDEGRPQAERVVRLALQEPPDPTHLRHRRQRHEVGLDRGTAFQRRVGHNGAQKRLARGEARDPAGLIEVPAGGDVALDEHDPLEGQPRGRLPEVGRQERPGERPHLVEPGQRHHGRIPPVNVGVDDRAWRHGGSPWLRR
jgi:hypothetical protein